ncbi:hypothetical protein GINT2_001378 [Glugoides intestinalis]
MHLMNKLATYITVFLYISGVEAVENNNRLRNTRLPRNYVSPSAKKIGTKLVEGVFNILRDEIDDEVIEKIGIKVREIIDVEKIRNRLGDEIVNKVGDRITLDISHKIFFEFTKLVSEFDSEFANEILQPLIDEVNIKAKKVIVLKKKKTSLFIADSQLCYCL